jgi:hypothetical protein
MPSASYYRGQAKLLLSLAEITSDPDYAEQLADLARLYWSEAKLPQAPRINFGELVDEFNARQLHGRPDDR